MVVVVVLDVVVVMVDQCFPQEMSRWSKSRGGGFPFKKLYGTTIVVNSITDALFIMYFFMPDGSTNYFPTRVFYFVNAL